MLNHRLKKSKITIRNFFDSIFDIFKLIYFSIKNLIAYLSIYSTKLVIVTGADYTHFKSLLNLIESVKKYEKDSELIVYDLGINSDQRNQLQDPELGIRLVKFDFNNYPSFYSERSKTDGKLGSYAWKSAIVKEVLEESSGSVLWLDAGDKITKKLTLIKIVLSSLGVYIPYSPGIISQWTHKKTLEKMNIDKKIFKKRNLASGMVGFNSNYDIALNIVSEWYEKSKDKELIAPKGSSRSNHRQDQSLLTLICYKKNIVSKLPATHKLFGIIVHQDPDKIYLSPVENNQELKEFRVKWYEIFSDISTNTLINADFVWLIDFSTINKFPKKYLDKLTIFVSFSKSDSSTNKNLLANLNKNDCLFFVTNNEDRNYLQSLGINKIEMVNVNNYMENCYKCIQNIIAQTT
ncbi:DUF1647 domain-containing protein [Acidimicrobiaceae bacterium]|nr:DUF1647 domain-containing protein [Acidimicrobiaceae bacterium]